MASRRTLLGLGLAVAMLAGGLLLLRPWEGTPGDLAERSGDAGSSVDAALRLEGSAEGPAATDPVLRGGAEDRAAPHEVPLAENEGTVAGRVVHGETGEPVPDVQVHAVEWLGPDERRVLASGVSAFDGTYRLAGLSERAWRVDVVATGGAWVNAEVARGPASIDVRRTWVVETRAGQVVPWNVRVLPAGRIEGSVRDVDGALVVGAIVHIPSIPGKGGPGATQPAFPWSLVPATATDGEGRFVLDGLPWGENVRVEAYREPGISVDSAPLDVRPPDATAVALVLPAVRAVLVRVVDAKTGQPVPEAAVRMRRRRGRRDDHSAQTGTTNGGGTVSLDPVAAVPLRLQVEASGYATWRSWKVEATREDAWVLFEPGAEGRYESTISLEPAAVLAGRVELPEGWPPTRVFLRMRCVGLEDAAQTLPAPGTYTRHAHLDDQGRFRRTVRPGRRWEISVLDVCEEWELEGHAQAASGDEDVVVRPLLARRTDEVVWEGAYWDLRFVGPEGMTLESAGLDVLWSGRFDYPPLQEVYGDLTARPDERDPDAGLRCRVPVSPQYGPVWITVSARAAEGEGLAEIVRGPFAPGGGEATISIPRARTIEGRVVDPTGRATQGVELEVRALRPSAMPETWDFSGLRDTAISDADGRFLLGDLDEGACEIRVRHAGDWVCPAHVVVDAGARDVVLRLLGGVEVDVVVRDEAGAPIAGARVAVRQEDGMRGLGADYWSNHDGVVTDVEGRAVLRSLEAGGTYLLKVVPPKTRVDELAWRDVTGWKPRDVEVVLPRLRPVSGVVRSPAGRPVEGASVFLREEDTLAMHRKVTDANGRFAFTKIPPGAVRVGACLPSLAPSWAGAALSLDVVVGATDIVLVVDPGRQVTFEIAALRREKERVHELRITPLGLPLRRYATHRVSVRHDADTVSVRGVRPGVRYRVWGGPTDSGLFAEAILEPANDRLALSLRQGGMIRGTIEWPGGVSNAWIGIDHQGVDFDMGLRSTPETFTLRGIPEGAWPVTLTWKRDGERHAVVKEASAGDVLTFDLTEPE